MLVQRLRLWSQLLPKIVSGAVNAPVGRQQSAAAITLPKESLWRSAMELSKRCLVLFLLGFVVDLVQTVHIQACAERAMMLSVSSIVGIYLIGFWGHDWFIKSESSFARWMLTLAGALGAGAGTGAAIYFGG
jgi:hypothetical protein